LKLQYLTKTAKAKHSIKFVTQFLSEYITVITLSGISMTSKFQLNKAIATVQDLQALQIRTVSRQSPDSIWVVPDGS